MCDIWEQLHQSYLMLTIPESELIINNRGAIYHLDVRPDELADTVITVGDPGRVPEVSKYFDRTEAKMEHREFITHTGYIGKKRISVLSTGIGPDNIDIAYNELDALANIDFETRTIKPEHKQLTLIRLGTCGGLQADAGTDTFVASTHGIGLDNLLNFYKHNSTDEENNMLQAFITATQSQAITQPYIGTASATLLKHFVEGYYHGLTVTCPGFYGPQGRVLRLGLTNPSLIDSLTAFRFGNNRILNFEMETSAMYGLARLMGHLSLSISVIVFNRITKIGTKDGAKAVDSLIKKSLEQIEKI